MKHFDRHRLPFLVRALALGTLMLVTSACATSASSTPSRVFDRAQEEQRRAAQEMEARGERAASMRQWTRAEQYFRLALINGGNEARLTARLVEVCVHDQRLRRAISHARRGLRERPEDYRLRFLTGVLLLSVGDVGRAQEALQRVLQQQPQHARGHYLLAVLYRDELGEPQAADRHFTAYLDLQPDGPHAAEARSSRLIPVLPASPSQAGPMVPRETIQ